MSVWNRVALVMATEALSAATDAQMLVIYSDGLDVDCLRANKDSGQLEESKGHRPNWNLGSSCAGRTSLTYRRDKEEED